MKQELNLSLFLRDDKKPRLTPYQFIGSDGKEGRIALDVFFKADQDLKGGKNQFIALITYPAYRSGVGTGPMARSIIRMIEYHHPNLEEEDVDFYVLELPKSRGGFPLLQAIVEDENAPLGFMRLNEKSCPFDFSAWQGTYPGMFMG